MGMQCGPVEGLSDGYIAAVFVYITQLLIHLRKKSLQERQEAFRIVTQHEKIGLMYT